MRKVKTVCVIDDDEIYTFVLNKLLKNSCLCEQILTFQNGEKAIKALKGWEDTQESFPEVVLLDINMPIMDGWEFLEQFKNLSEEKRILTQVYIVSSSISKHDVEKAKSFPEVSDFLTKPLTNETLIKVLSIPEN